MLMLSGITSRVVTFTIEILLQLVRCLDSLYVGIIGRGIEPPVFATEVLFSLRTTIVADVPILGGSLTDKPCLP
jgi:hypothetical protein